MGPPPRTEKAQASAKSFGAALLMTISRGFHVIVGLLNMRVLCRQKLMNWEC